MPRLDLISNKLGSINIMISDLSKNRKVMARIGGYTVETMGEEVKMQGTRAANLEWAAAATDAEIQAKISEITSMLTPDERACKYGSVRGLPIETVTAIAMIEDLEIALGTHPALGVK